MLPAALAALIPLLGWWLYRGEPREDQAPPTPGIVEGRVSYYLRDVSLTASGENGRREYRVLAERIRRFDDTETWTFRQPRWSVYMEQGPPWHGKADFGRAWNGGDEARLSGNVRLHRPEGTDSRPLEVVTSEVYLRPREDYASTERPVVANAPGMRLRGIGAEVFMADEQLRLKSHVEGLYDGNLSD